MCTAATYKTKDFYFGRTLDYDFSYGDEVTVTPRHFGFDFGAAGRLDEHYALIGMAHIENGYPLYYEAVNEKGLCMAGLNFVGSAVYGRPCPGKDNIPQYAFIPWVLGQCATVDEARRLLQRLNLTDQAFCDGLPAAQLHWLLADRDQAVTVEAVAAGLQVLDNPVGVLTNNPPFATQMFMLNNYMSLTVDTPADTFAPGLALQSYSRGMGALGLPGDLSSQSRFVRAAFVRMNARSGEGENESVSQFFHILGSVDQQRGCCRLPNGRYEITLYTCCCNASRGVYYYTTYDNHRITAVDMHREDLQAAELVRYTPVADEQIFLQNG